MVLASGLAGCAAPEAPPERVFLVTIDTLRADRLGCLGYPRDVSPFLDRLAGEGVLFTRAFASSSTTIASHASLFTSLEPPQHQMIRNGVEMSPALFTMAEMFRRRGYETAGFTTVNFMTGVADGFETFDTEQEFHPAGHVVGKALEWLAGRGGEDSFFLWVHLFDVHEWFNPTHVDEASRARAAALAPSGAELGAYLRRQHGSDLATLGGEAEALAAVDRYDGQLLAVDAALERLFETAEERGLNDGALWVVTADHGEGLGSHR